VSSTTKTPRASVRGVLCFMLSARLVGVIDANQVCNPQS
jgi:hypothetical protein